MNSGENERTLILMSPRLIYKVGWSLQSAGFLLWLGTTLALISFLRFDDQVNVKHYKSQIPGRANVGCRPEANIAQAANAQRRIRSRASDQPHYLVKEWPFMDNESVDACNHSSDRMKMTS